MYISNHLTYTRARTFETNGNELLCVEITPHKSNCPLFIAGVYRAPDSSAELDEQFETITEHLYLTNKEALLLGDINVNILDNKVQSTV